MNHFHDYKLENYVCMNVKKDTYINNYYEKHIIDILIIKN